MRVFTTREGRGDPPTPDTPLANPERPAPPIPFGATVHVKNERISLGPGDDVRIHVTTPWLKVSAAFVAGAVIAETVTGVLLWLT